MNKIKTLIGFAIKSNNILLGQSKIKYYKKDIDLILVSNDATNNLLNLATNVANKKHCKLIQLDSNFNDLIGIENIKILAITSQDLANGIIGEYSKHI